jgi:membrane associated rhomboid family serine protease
MIPIRDETPRFSTPFVTYFIIALNTVVFLFELSVGGQGHQALNGFMYHFGVVPLHFERVLAAWPDSSLAGLFVPILTSMFLHASWLHIIGNMWVLWIFGDNIEDYLGHFPYLLFYLVCGFAAAVAHILLNAGSNVPSVGASGAIAGVMGAYFVLYPRARVLIWFPPIFFFHLPAWLVWDIGSLCNS